MKNFKLKAIMLASMTMFSGFVLAESAQLESDIPSVELPVQEQVVEPVEEAAPEAPVPSESFWDRVKKSWDGAVDAVTSDEEESESGEGETADSGKQEAPVSQAGAVSKESEVTESTDTVSTNSESKKSLSDDSDPDVSHTAGKVVIDDTAYQALISHYNALQSRVSEYDNRVEAFCFPKAK